MIKFKRVHAFEEFIFGKFGEKARKKRVIVN